MLDLLTRLTNHFMPQARNGLCWTRFCHHQQTSWGRASQSSSRGARTPAPLALQGACGRPGAPDRLPSPGCPQIMQLLTKGNRQRTQEPTATNKTSSRSHAVLQVIVRRRGRGAHPAEEVRVGRLFMVDLAGSERASQVRVLSDPSGSPSVPRRLQHLEQRPAPGRRPPSESRANASSAGAGRQAASERFPRGRASGHQTQRWATPRPALGELTAPGRGREADARADNEAPGAPSLEIPGHTEAAGPRGRGSSGPSPKGPRSSAGESKPLRRRARCLRGGCRDVRRGPAHHSGHAYSSRQPRPPA